MWKETRDTSSSLEQAPHGSRMLLKRLLHRHVECAEVVAQKAVADAASAVDVSPDDRMCSRQ